MNLDEIWIAEIYENPDEAVEYEFYDGVVIRAYLMEYYLSQAMFLRKTIMAGVRQ